MYSALITPSEYTCFYLSKDITSFTVLLVFKIVKRLRVSLICNDILNQNAKLLSRSHLVKEMGRDGRGYPLKCEYIWGAFRGDGMPMRKFAYVFLKLSNHSINYLE